MSRSALLGSLIVMLVGVGEARAEYQQSPYVGISGGYNLRLRDWDLGGFASADGALPGQPTSSAIVGLRIGYMFLKQLGVEASTSYLPVYSSNGDNLNTVLKYDLNAIFHLTSGNWVPFLTAGVGLYQKVSGGDGDLGKDVDPLFQAGVGLRGLLAPWVALRIDVRDVISDGFDDWGSNNLEMIGGFDFFFTPKKAEAAAVAITDRDHDGVADLNDQCPTEPGPAATAGCPDKDGDSVIDSQDKCPTQPGKPALGGCPDRDNDGVIDSQDKCPDQAGRKELGGCPDQDNDGIADAEDKCPDQAGPPELNGCPDRDGDGVLDSEDKCPEQAGRKELAGCPDQDNDGIADSEDKCPAQAGPAATAGCPDKDGDGVPDSEDKCPDKAGLRDYQGCLPKPVEKYVGTIQGISFDTGKATIKKSSNKTLDAAAKVLATYPALKLRVEGHTDNVGPAEDNKKLSQERADAVKAYLVGKGIDAGRLEAVGFGDSRPVKDNKTEKGRAANRRIEFAIIQ